MEKNPNEEPNTDASTSFDEIERVVDSLADRGELGPEFEFPKKPKPEGEKE